MKVPFLLPAQQQFAQDHQTIHEPKQQKSTKSLLSVSGCMAEQLKMKTVRSYSSPHCHVLHSARGFLPAGSLVTACSRGEHDNCPHKQLLSLTRAALLLTDSLSTTWRSRERKTDSALNSDDLTESK